MRYGLLLTGVVAVALLFSAGIAPGGYPSATVDGCYVRIGDWQPDEYRCRGHWSMLFHRVDGPIDAVTPEPAERWWVTGGNLAGWGPEVAPREGAARPVLATPWGATA